MDLDTLNELVAARAARWDAAGATWELLRGPATPKPAAWVVLSNASIVGQLTVWTSGEAELDWGDVDTGGAAHYDLASRDDLEAALDVLEIELGLA